MKDCYDAAVIGGGPAGCAAALYCAQAGFATVLLEGTAFGGQMATTNAIDNYPGFPAGTDGYTLGREMAESARRAGAEVCQAQVTAARLTGRPKELETALGVIRAHAVILAGGAYPKTLGLPEEPALRGRGVSYCATCDGGFYRGKRVVVVGGGNSAAGEALHLARLCAGVTLIHRRDRLSANRTYLEDLKRAGVAFCLNSRVTAIRHGDTVTGVEVEDAATGARRELACDGVFVAVGRAPDTALYRGQVELDDRGYVVADETTRTSCPGVFAAGDLRTKPVRQIVTAAADGAVCARYVEEYLLDLVRQAVRATLERKERPGRR